MQKECITYYCLDWLLIIGEVHIAAFDGAHEFDLVGDVLNFFNGFADNSISCIVACSHINVDTPICVTV